MKTVIDLLSSQGLQGVAAILETGLDLLSDDNPNTYSSLVGHLMQCQLEYPEEFVDESLYSVIAGYGPRLAGALAMQQLLREYSQYRYRVPPVIKMITEPLPLQANAWFLSQLIWEALWFRKDWTPDRPHTYPAWVRTSPMWVFLVEASAQNRRIYPKLQWAVKIDSEEHILEVEEGWSWGQEFTLQAPLSLPTDHKIELVCRGKVETPLQCLMPETGEFEQLIYSGLPFIQGEATYQFGCAFEVVPRVLTVVTLTGTKLQLKTLSPDSWSTRQLLLYLLDFSP